MTDHFLHGISFTGSLKGGRAITIPELERHFDPYLLATPQGEDERPNWLLEIIGRTLKLPGMERRNRASFRNYSDLPDVNFRGDKLVIPPATLGIYDELVEAAQVLNGVYGASRYWRRPLQAGHPFPGDYATFTFPTRPDLAAKFRPAFDTVIAQEIKREYVTFGDRIVTWLESPGSLLAMHSAHKTEQDLGETATAIAQDFAQFTRQLPYGVKVFIHLCHGDLNRKSWLGNIESLWPMVILANAIHVGFPRDHAQLGGIHLPTCAGDVLPSLDPRFFGPLAGLHPQAPIILGNIHEMVSLRDMSIREAVAHNLRSFEMATNARGVPFKAGSFSCGAGRMSNREFQAGLDVMSNMFAVAGRPIKR